MPRTTHVSLAASGGVERRFALDIARVLLDPGKRGNVNRPSRLAMETVDLLTLKDLAGWKTLSTVQRDAHLSAGHQQQAIERLVTQDDLARTPLLLLFRSVPRCGPNWTRSGCPLSPASSTCSL